MLTEIETIQAIKILGETATTGSSPLVVLDTQGNEYYAKSCSLSLPRVELINEVFSALTLPYWGVDVPAFRLIRIPYHLVETYNAENKQPLSDRYSEAHFETLFFGSLKVSPIVELPDYLAGINKNQFKLFKQPGDLIKIGLFDQWIGNRDRKPENPNILLVQKNGKLYFSAIDHTAAFSHLANYQEVRDIMLRLDPKYSILACKLTKDILRYLPAKGIEKIKDEIREGIDNINGNFDDLIGLIPSDWGLSKKAKAHLKQFFSDQQRNQRIINTFVNI